MYDFAVSYFRPDRAWADWIAATMARYGARAVMLEAGRQALTGSPGQDAIWIPLVSTSSGRPATHPEWWWWYESSGEVDAQARPLVIDVIEQPDGQAWPDLLAAARDHGEARATDVLCESVGLTGGETEGRTSVFGVGRPLFPPLRPAVWNVPARNPYFTGREESLAQLRDSFKAHPRTLQVIAGPSGIGKTSAAIEYAYRHRTHYRGCWWVEGARRGETQPQWPQHLPDEQGDAELPWLFILDSAPGQFAALLDVADSDCHVLATCDDPPAGSTVIREIGGLSTSESSSLAARLLDLTDGILPDQIAELGNGQPLAIWLMSYLLRPGMSTASSTEDISRKMAAAITSADSAAEAAVHLVIDTMAGTHPDSVELLQLMAGLSSGPLPIAAMQAGAWALPNHLTTACRSQPDLWELADPLVLAGLLRRDRERLVLHDAGHQIAMAVTENRPHRRGQAANLVLAAAHAYRHEPPDSSNWTDLLPHLITVADSAESLAPVFPASSIADYLDRRRSGHVNRPDILVALDTAAQHFAMSNQQDVALNLAIRAARYAERNDHEPLADRVTQLIALASYERAANHPHEALQHLLQAQQVLRDSLPANEQYRADWHQQLLQELVWTYSDLGDHGAALPLAERLDLLGRRGAFGAGFDSVGADRAHAYALRRARRLPEARAVLEQCLGASFGDRPRLRHRTELIQLDLAEVLLDLGEPGGALDLLESCTPKLRSWFGPHHPVTVTALTQTARALTELSRHQDALAAAAEAVTIAESTDSATLVCDAQVIEAAALLAAGRIPESIFRYQESIQNSDSSDVSINYRIAVRQAAADALTKIGAVDDAAQVLSEAVELLSGGEEDTDLAVSLLQSLSQAEIMTGDVTAAISHAERARTLVSNADNPPLSLNLNCHVLLGRALVDGGRAHEAIPLLTAALHLAEQSDATEAEEVLNVQAALAQALRATGDINSCLAVCDQAIAAFAQEPGRADLFLGRLSVQRGAALLDFRRADDATEAFRAAVQAIERFTGLVDVTLARILAEIGNLLLKSGHPASASSYFRRAWHIWCDLVGTDCTPAAECLDSLGQSWVAIGGAAQAISLHEQAVSIVQQSLGDHPFTAVCLFNLGLAFNAAGRPDLATGVLQQATQIDERVFGSDHPEVATDLRALAAVLERAQRPDEAHLYRMRADRIQPAATDE